MEAEAPFMAKFFKFMDHGEIWRFVNIVNGFQLLRDADKCIEDVQATTICLSFYL